MKNWFVLLLAIAAPGYAQNKDCRTMGTVTICLNPAPSRAMTAGEEKALQERVIREERAVFSLLGKSKGQGDCEAARAKANEYARGDLLHEISTLCGK